MPKLNVRAGQCIGKLNFCIGVPHKNNIAAQKEEDMQFDYIQMEQYIAFNKDINAKDFYKLVEEAIEAALEKARTHVPTSIIVPKNDNIIN